MTRFFEMKKFRAMLAATLWLTIAITPAWAEPPSTKAIVAPDGSKQLWVRSQSAVAELWLAEGNAPARQIFAFPGEVIAEAAWSPDGQSVAFIRAPLGSETDALTEVWRLDVRNRRLTQLTRNNLPDHAPRWSADGRTLTVRQGGQSVTLPANRLSVDDAPFPPPKFSPLPRLSSPARLTAPTEIRVIHSASNDCRDVPEGQIDVIPFEEYVKRVTPHESPAWWDAAALQAQAVAARTYAWNKIIQNAGNDWDVTDWIDYQYMCNDTYPSTNAAVDATAGEYLAQNGVPIVAMYSAENSSPTKSSVGVTYLRAIEDPVSFGEARNGHGYGMGQWGAYRWASQFGWDYTAILRHYYSFVTLEASAALTDTTPPKIAFIQPWHNRYITGNRLWVQTNVTDDGVISDTRIFLTVLTQTQLLTDTLVDISTVPDQPQDAAAPTLTADAGDMAGNRAVAPPVTFGIDRRPPTALWAGGSVVLTGSLVVSSTIIAADDTAGVAWLAVGQQTWVWQGEDFQLGVGQVVTDTDALDGRAVQATVADAPAGAWTLPEVWLPGGTPYRAYVRLKAATINTGAEVATVSIWANEALIGLRRLHGFEFRAVNSYQEFGVDFLLPPASGSVALPFIVTVDFLDVSDLSFDRMAIFEYPIPFQNTLPAGAPLDARVKVIDGAGNASADLQVVRAVQAVYLPLVLR